MRILIAGAGGLGREVLAYALDAIDAGTLTGEVAGFLDDTEPDLSPFGLTVPIVGSIVDYAPRADERVIVAIGDPQGRSAVVDKLHQRGAAFATLVHPRAWIGRNATVAEGAIIAPFATIGPWARLHPHALINTHAGVGHDAVIGQGAVLSPHAVVNGGVSLGPRAFLGTNAAVMAHQTIAADAKIAAGAVVYTCVPEGATALGNPARIMPSNTTTSR